MTATATALSPQEQVKAIDAKIEKLKSEIEEHAAELNLIAVQQRRASDKDLPSLLRRKEIVESYLERDRAALIEQQNASAESWAIIRRAEDDERYRQRTEEPLKLGSDILAAVGNLKSALATLNPQGVIIAKNLVRLRQIINSEQANTFPIPVEIQESQKALRSSYEELRALRTIFESMTGG